MRTVFNTPEALEDIRQAAFWYNKQKAGLGKEFTTRIRKAKKILATQTDFVKRENNLHTMPLRPFPYLLHYQVINDDSIAIIAVLSTSLDPEQNHPLAH